MYPCNLYSQDLQTNQARKFISISKWKLLRLLVLMLLWPPLASSDEGDQSFEHSHELLTQVLAEHVYWNSEGTSSRVDYQSLKQQPGKLESYLKSLSEVSREEFQTWTQARQLAFLINAYNGFTLKLILDHYPVDSIKDIGSFWQNPWKMRFFRLLGEPMHLDQIEHDIIREPGRFDEPRIHFAVNCAAVGCPALRAEAYLGERLDAQLKDSSQRFLRDQRRNRLSEGKLLISSIFDWYREDFTRGWRGVQSLAEFLPLYSEALRLSSEAQERLLAGQMPIEFLDYNWALNDYATRDPEFNSSDPVTQ